MSICNLTAYWFARGYFDGRSNGVFDDEVAEFLKLLHDETLVAYKGGYDSGVLDYVLVDANDGQPDEAQEWHDFNPDC
jgi:hypothetical protein